MPSGSQFEAAAAAVYTAHLSADWPWDERTELIWTSLNLPLSILMPSVSLWAQLGPRSLPTISMTDFHWRLASQPGRDKLIPLYVDTRTP